MHKSIGLALLMVLVLLIAAKGMELSAMDESDDMDDSLSAFLMKRTGGAGVRGPSANGGDSLSRAGAALNAAADTLVAASVGIRTGNNAAAADALTRSADNLRRAGLSLLNAGGKK